jgi:hypothetical protein
MPSQLSSSRLSSAAQPPPPRPRQDGRSGLAGYAAETPAGYAAEPPGTAGASADPFDDEGARPAGGGRNAAELFPPETFKTQSFEAADRTQAFHAVDDLVARPAEEDDAYVDPGRVGDR